MSASDREQGQPAGVHDRERDAYQAAVLHVCRVSAIHAEVGAGRARRGEEADDDLDQQA